MASTPARSASPTCNIWGISRSASSSAAPRRRNPDQSLQRPPSQAGRTSLQPFAQHWGRRLLLACVFSPGPSRPFLHLLQLGDVFFAPQPYVHRSDQLRPFDFSHCHPRLQRLPRYSGSPGRLCRCIQPLPLPLFFVLLDHSCQILHRGSLLLPFPGTTPRPLRMSAFTQLPSRPLTSRFYPGRIQRRALDSKAGFSSCSVVRGLLSIDHRDLTCA